MGCKKMTLCFQVLIIQSNLKCTKHNPLFQYLVNKDEVEKLREKNQVVPLSFTQVLLKISLLTDCEQESRRFVSCGAYRNI